MELCLGADYKPVQRMYCDQVGLDLKGPCRCCTAIYTFCSRLVPVKREHVLIQRYSVACVMFTSVPSNGSIDGART